MVENTTMREQIISIVEEKANNNPAPNTCTILSISEDYVSVTLDNEDNRKLSHLKKIGEGSIGDKAVIIYPDGESNNPLVICSTTNSTMNTILALGLGLFTIRDDGHLYVELPMGLTNFFSIDEDGHLIVSLPSGVSNDYHLEGDGHLYYYRRE